MLNKGVTGEFVGSIGGFKTKWTKEKVIEYAKQFDLDRQYDNENQKPAPSARGSPPPPRVHASRPYSRTNRAATGCGTILCPGQSKALPTAFLLPARWTAGCRACHTGSRCEAGNNSPFSRPCCPRNKNPRAGYGLGNLSSTPMAQYVQQFAGPYWLER